jgi:hypothetical protein
MPAGQVLNRKRAELALHWLQDVLVARCGRRSDLVTGTQPVSARLLDSERRRMHVRPGDNLSLDFSQRCAGFFLGSGRHAPVGRDVPAAQLFSLPVNAAGVDGHLVAHDRPVAGAATYLDAPDLRRQVATFSHHRQAS